MYKVLSRAGTLSTTGHSTNFCLWLEYPTRDDPTKWVRAGVAIFLALLYWVNYERRDVYLGHRPGGMTKHFNALSIAWKCQ